MNLILLFPEDFLSAETVRLEGRRARHVREVLRAEPGDRVVVGAVNGAVGEGTVLPAGPEEVRLSIRLGAEPPPPPGIDLLLAMPRPKVLRRVLQSAASLGAKRVVLVNASRVERSYFDTPFLEPAEVERNLVLGLEQARDTVLPEVLVRPRFRPFVEDELEGLWPLATRARLLAHPASAAAAPPGPGGEPQAPALLAIGPEGGWVPFELELLEAHGFSRFDLGPRILRVETAVPFAYGRIRPAAGVPGASPTEGGDDDASSGRGSASPTPSLRP